MNQISKLLTRKTVSGFSKRSDSIFDVFTKTQKECETLNLEIDEHVKKKNEEILKLQSEVSTLNGVKFKNNNLSRKIEAFIQNDPPATTLESTLEEVSLRGRGDVNIG